MVEAKLDCEATTISVSWKKPEEGTMTGYRVTCLTKEEVEKEKENKEKEGKEKKRIIRCLFYHVVFFIVDSKEGIHFFPFYFALYSSTVSKLQFIRIMHVL